MLPIPLKRSLSLVVLCRNEVEHIENCLQSILAFERPENSEIEILVVDGMSDDGTRNVLKRMAGRHPEIRILDNPQKTTPCAFNIAIAHSLGNYLVIFSSHAQYSRNYLTESIATAERTNAENVGGVFVTRQNGIGYGAALVQALTTHKFGVGSSFRTDLTEGPADTVSYGCYRREVFEYIGRFDERLVRAQDYEMNCRLRRAGGIIWKNPLIQVFYFNQKTLVAFLKKQFFLDAPYNAYMWYLAPYAFAPRHAITGVFAAGVVGGLVIVWLSPLLGWVFAGTMTLYFAIALLAGIQQAVRYRQALHILTLPLCFFLYHFLHGMGILMGLVRLAAGQAPVQQCPEPWPGAGIKRISAAPGRFPSL